MKMKLLPFLLASTGLLAGRALAQDYPPATPTGDTQDSTLQDDTGQTDTTSTTEAGTGNYLPDQAVGSGNGFADAFVGRTNGNSGGGFGSNASDFNFFQGHPGRRTGYGLLGGYRWKVGPDVGVGVEGGYADLGNYRLRNVFNSGSVNQRDTVNALHGWLLGANARINLVPQWYLSAHGGLFWANDNNTRYYNTVAQDLGFSSGHKAGRTSWYAGVGTGWDFNRNFSLGVAYDYFHAKSGSVTNPSTGETISNPKRSTGMVSLVGEYRF